MSVLLFPREPEVQKGVCNRSGNCLGQAELTPPDPFNICPPPQNCEMAVVTRAAECLPWRRNPLHIAYCFKLMLVHIVYKRL